jgi:hypothetical protein
MDFSQAKGESGTPLADAGKRSGVDGSIIGHTDTVGNPDANMALWRCAAPMPLPR